MDYTTLVGAKGTAGSIRNQVNWDHAPAEQILEDSYSWLANHLKVREMVTIKQDTLALGANTLALPDRFASHIKLRLYGSVDGEIDILNPEHFEQRLGFDTSGVAIAGMPSCGAIAGTTLQLDLKAQANYTYRWWHYAMPAALGPSNQTNFLTDRYSHILRAVTSYWAYIHKRNLQMAAQQQELALEHVENANANADMEQNTYRTEAYWSR